ncbi:MAG: hypothetical protein M3P51_19180 [Chloroflexota bacterium]|nr:hypothetical protein [Chloroflexota bacterium]
MATTAIATDTPTLRERALEAYRQSEEARERARQQEEGRRRQEAINQLHEALHEVLDIQQEYQIEWPEHEPAPIAIVEGLRLRASTSWSADAGGQYVVLMIANPGWRHLQQHEIRNLEGLGRVLSIRLQSLRYEVGRGRAPSDQCRLCAGVGISNYELCGECFPVEVVQ